MRRFGLLAALLLSLLVPAAVRAGGCPAGEPGVVDEGSYRLGEVIDFFDSYHDFADPGTVTITFERTADGATREFTAFDGPDGTWYLMLTFESTGDIGTWDVTVVVDQTDALDKCTDRVTITGRSGMPNTATIAPPPEARHDGDAALWAFLSLGGLAGALMVMRHRRDVDPRSP